MSTQDHIHIATTLAGSPEFAPAFTWKVVFPDYQEVPTVILSQKRTSSGKLRWHTINNADGPIQFMGYRLTLNVHSDGVLSARDYLQRLKDMNGKSVFFVDFDHPDNGSDHTSYVKTMRFLLTRPHPMVNDLSYYQVEVELEDDFTV